MVWVSNIAVFSVKITPQTGRWARALAISVVFSLIALFIGKVTIDWRLRHLDEASKPTVAKLQEQLDEANAAQTQLDQTRRYRLSDDLKSALHIPSQFVQYHKVADVPQPVRLAFAKAAEEENFFMADPGGKWEATDVIIDARLPRRRLSAVAVGAGLCLLFYEHGGIGRNNNIAVFRLGNGQAEANWHAYVPDDVVDSISLAEALRKNQFREAPYF